MTNTELRTEAERKDFEVEFPRAVWDASLCGYTESMYTYALSGWLAARRATIQPTAAEPVQTIVSYRPDTSKRKPCSYMEADGTCEKCRGSRYCVSPPEYEMVPVYRTAPVAPADAVRDARDLALEEAAKLFDASPHAEEYRAEIAASIRALKSTSTEG